MKLEFKIVTPSTKNRKSLIQALSVLAVVMMASATQDTSWLFGFAGIFGGEFARFATIALRAILQLKARLGQKKINEEIQNNYCATEHKTELLDRSVLQIGLAAAGHCWRSRVTPQIAALLAARLRAAIGGISHVSLTCRLLPAPFFAR